jgi:TMEM175 potassium channel family protein
MTADGTGRLEAFSDGVFAIAMTLLVLDMKVPHDLTSGGTLAQALVGQWPTYLAFATSFATILIMWVNHHRVFTHIGRRDDGLLFSNGLLLLGVVLVPFPTALVAEYLGRAGQKTAALIYNSTFIAIALCFNLLWRSASTNGRLLRTDHDRDAVRHITDSFRYGPLFYVVTLIVGLFSVTASLTVSCALAIYYALPSRTAAAIGHGRAGHNARESERENC